MLKQSNIFLVGLMGAGKTTIGRQLAHRLDKKFYDSDHEIEQRTGVNVPTIFDIEGEEGFRNRETKMLDELTQLDNIVLATGGGAVLREENRQYIHDRGIVIYLRASNDVLVQRTRRDKNRPLLNQGERQVIIEQLMTEREPLYRQLADIEVNTDDQPPAVVAGKIIEELESKKLHEDA